MSNSTRPWAAIITLLAVGIVILALTIAPSLSSVHLRAHAVQRHGNDALMARMVNRVCVPLAWYCPASWNRPARFYLVCQESAGERCAVTVVGSKGAEFTSYTTACDRIFSQVAFCEEAVVEQ